jgi:vancomycin resistance protein VanW
LPAENAVEEYQEMQRKLFCQIHPAAYSISVCKEKTRRHLKWLFDRRSYSSLRDPNPLSHIVHAHGSLIRRKLGDVNMALQDNKAVNLALAADRISGILIRPGEVFSFWRTVGSCTRGKGYREGLVIRGGMVSSGTGGGLCQLTNLIHWMILHSPLMITEHHHHDGFDLFPDSGRQLPFGTGTSVVYNYLDYQFLNPTGQSFQLFVHTDEEYLNGELRSEHPLETSYHVQEEDSHFARIDGVLYRKNRIFRTVVNRKTGEVMERSLIKQNHARVMYDCSMIDPSRIRT